MKNKTLTKSKGNLTLRFKTNPNLNEIFT